MKKCKCKCGCKLGKLLGKLLGAVLLANVVLFIVFFFDLDGKLLFKVVEPLLCKLGLTAWIWRARAPMSWLEPLRCQLMLRWGF